MKAGKPTLNVELEMAEAGGDSCEGISEEDEDPNHLPFWSRRLKSELPAGSQPYWKLAIPSQGSDSRIEGQGLEWIILFLIMVWYKLGSEQNEEDTLSKLLELAMSYPADVVFQETRDMSHLSVVVDTHSDVRLVGRTSRGFWVRNLGPILA
ncbi:hypothetical protein HPG69_010191 [Diceros bicornis minor]|uniref:Uncharacterized protein n=1 Tax=Diceros bicornis minor TaxID=77932 RepID=A0A7J7EE17_DICBM|nr:hypothetical protein HPG69_010191 [Diceros bicornis minor]